MIRHISLLCQTVNVVIRQGGPGSCKRLILDITENILPPVIDPRLINGLPPVGRERFGGEFGKLYIIELQGFGEFYRLLKRLPCFTGRSDEKKPKRSDSQAPGGFNGVADLLKADAFVQTIQDFLHTRLDAEINARTPRRLHFAQQRFVNTINAGAACPGHIHAALDDPVTNGLSSSAVNAEIVVKKIDLANAIPGAAFLYLAQDGLGTARIVRRVAGFAKQTAVGTAFARHHDGEVLALRCKFGVKVIGQKMARRIRVVVENRIPAVRGHRCPTVFLVNQTGHIGEPAPAFQLLQQPRQGVKSAVEAAEIGSLYRQGLVRVNPQIITADDYRKLKMFFEKRHPFQRFTEHIGRHHETQDVRFPLFQPVQDVFLGQTQRAGVDQQRVVSGFLGDRANPGQRERREKPEIFLNHSQVFFMQLILKWIENARQSHFSSTLFS